jgi:hypothetical protein
MVIQVSHLGLQHRGEPIIEVDTDGQLVTTHFRGLDCFINYWPLTELDSPTLRRLHLDRPELEDSTRRPPNGSGDTLVL